MPYSSLQHIALIYLTVINVVTFFMYGVPLILIAQIALIFLCSCRTKQHVDAVTPISHEYVPEHSPNQ